jgi:hypothetical protein
VQGDGRHRATAASASQLQFNRTIGNINQLDIAAICLQRRPYLTKSCFYLLTHKMPPLIATQVLTIVFLYFIGSNVISLYDSKLLDEL